MQCYFSAVAPWVHTNRVLFEKFISDTVVLTKYTFWFFGPFWDCLWWFIFLVTKTAHLFCIDVPFCLTGYTNLFLSCDHVDSILNLKYSFPLSTRTLSTIALTISLSLNPYFFCRMSCNGLTGLSQSASGLDKPNSKWIEYGGGGSLKGGRSRRVCFSYAWYFGVLNFRPLNASLTDKGLMSTRIMPTCICQ